MADTFCTKVVVVDQLRLRQLANAVCSSMEETVSMLGHVFFAHSFRQCTLFGAHFFGIGWGQVAPTGLGTGAVFDPVQRHPPRLLEWPQAMVQSC
jgi:hypothetical protein